MENAAFFLFNSFYDILTSPVFLPRCQGPKKPSFGFDFYTVAKVDTKIVLTVLGGITTLAFLIIYGTYRYQRWCKFKEFENEMKSLDLNPDQEGTLGDMVRRYQIGEPVQILYSPKLFDDLATAEMRRILGSQGSVETKQKFIDAIYDIRTKTYHPDWTAAMSTEDSSFGR